ncbi:MAG TPA: hypothetical protein VE173_01055, partial [Longimicrobiales bacterium]|nr:hypothetical protein [Longimicrobiales bacterium]
APLRDRIRVAGRAGALVGGLAGFLITVLSAPWLLPRASLAGEEGAYRAAFEATPWLFILGYAAVSAAIGAALATLTRSVTGWFERGMRLVGSLWGSVVLGAGIGLVLGLLVGGVIVGGGSASTVTEGIVVVPVLGSMVWSTLGWLAGGWAVGAAVQALGVPAGIGDAEVEEVGAVKRRLGSAYGIPLLAMLTIGLLVLPIGYLFINFPEWAPFLGIFVAIGILSFAGLSASRPHARLRAGDFLAALAGIGVVVVIVVAVLVAQGRTGGQEGETTEPAPTGAAGSLLL